MAEKELHLSSRDVEHERLMRSILKVIGDTPLVLKGGTALLMAYDLSRFSEDLDFDAPLKLNLQSRIQRSVPHGITLDGIDALKDTGTVTRYRAKYHTEHGPRSLKLEISYRTPAPQADIRVVDGIRVASLPRIIDQKLKAAHDGQEPRSKVRDLYDLEFAARRWPAAFTGDLAVRMAAYTEDPAVLESRYQADYDEDDLVPDIVELQHLALSAHYAAQELVASRPEVDRRIEGLPTLRDASETPVRCFSKHATAAVATMSAGGGSVYEVDWRDVEQKTIKECLALGVEKQAIGDSLASTSPGSASASLQANLRERIVLSEASQSRAELPGAPRLSSLQSGSRLAYKQALGAASGPAWAAEQESRAAALERPAATATGALLTFSELGAQAIQRAGAASRVDWRAVEDAAVERSLRVDSQPADAVYAAIAGASPAAMTVEQQSALRDRVNAAAHVMKAELQQGQLPAADSGPTM